MPDAVKTLAFAYAASGAAIAAASVAAFLKERAKVGPAGPWLDGAPLELARRPERYAFNNGAVGLEIQRDGRGAAFVMGAERGGFAIDLFRRPLDPLQARGHFFYVSEEDEAPWSIGFEPARRAGDYRIEETRLQPSRDRQRAERDRSAHGDRARPRRRDLELAHQA